MNFPVLASLVPVLSYVYLAYYGFVGHKVAGAAAVQSGNG